MNVLQKAGRKQEALPFRVSERNGDFSPIGQTRSCHSKPLGRSSAANSKCITRRGSGFEQEDEA
jgi:hypothetical protein